MKLLAPTVACSLVISIAVAAGASAAGPAVKTTATGVAAAKASLLTAGDLGKGWKSSGAAATGFALACKGYAPSGAGIVENGSAGTPSISGGTVGPFISQTTGVFATSAQAATLWKRAVTPGLITCIVQTVQTIGATGQGVTVKVTSKGPLTIKKATKLESAYRVIATLTSAKVKYKRTLYFDVVVVGKGSTVSEITFSSLQAPVPLDVEGALGAIVAHRIGLRTA
ncbi:MAG TPA: hypothetical protein VGM80_15720 [Gaiellaceae bacterium]|jgi:hypothetical protein